MAEDGMNICETFYNHQVVRQLLSIIREAQAACTENECYPTNRLPGPQSTESSTDMFLITVIVGVLLFLFAYMPRSIRHSSQDAAKSRDNAPDSNGDPPAPPPAAN